jgi:DNA-binding transcriptional ArsR family regulator
MSLAISLDENFLLIWRRFLEMEIIRSQHCLKLAGSANAYLVLQVICWHHFLLVGEELEDTSLDATREIWIALASQPGAKGKKLTYALIAELTGLDKETVRRNVKALAERGFVKADRKLGVMYAPTEERNDQIVNELNVTERRLVMQFAQTFERYGSLAKSGD